jgi:hypothetical protein
MSDDDLTFTLAGEEAKAFAHRLVDEAKDGWRFRLLRPRRSNEQNKAMWPILHDLSAQVNWYGRKLSPEEWKDCLTASLRKCKVVPTVDMGDGARGLVVLGLHTSDMSDEEMSNLIALGKAFGDEQHVKWSSPKWLEQWAAQQRGYRAK